MRWRTSEIGTRRSASRYTAHLLPMGIERAAGSSSRIEGEAALLRAEHLLQQLAGALAEVLEHGVGVEDAQAKERAQQLAPEARELGRGLIELRLRRQLLREQEGLERVFGVGGVEELRVALLEVELQLAVGQLEREQPGRFGDDREIVEVLRRRARRPTRPKAAPAGRPRAQPEEAARRGAPRKVSSSARAAATRRWAVADGPARRAWPR